MKDGIVQLMCDKNIFYDSNMNLYRYRMHCPECGKLGECRCYEKLDMLMDDIEEGIADFTCSAKCCLINGDWDELEDAMEEIGLEMNIKESLSKLTSEQSFKALKEFDTTQILLALLSVGSDLTFSEIKNPDHQKRLQILWEMGEAEDVLIENDIDYLPKCEDLTEKESQDILEILTDGAEFDCPAGEECPI